MQVTVYSTQTMSVIQDAINNNSEIYFDSGVYSITKTLVIPSNRKIVMAPDAVLKRTAAIQAIFLPKVTTSVTKYNGASNIEICGGQLYGVDSVGSYDNFITLFHASNINIHDIEFLDIQGCHGVEINSSKHVRCKNLRFRGYRSNTAATFREAIQIDFAGFSEFVLSGSSNTNACYDNTCCEDIIIEGCTFEESPYHDAPNTAIGMHSRPYGNTRHRGIKILNNYAIAGKYAGVFVSLMAAEDVIIKGNHVEGYSRFVKITNPLKSYTCNGTAISTVANDDDGISKKVNIEDNFIDNPSATYVVGGVFVSSDVKNRHVCINVIGNIFDVPSTNTKSTQYASYNYIDTGIISANSYTDKYQYPKIYSATTSNIKEL